MSFEDLFNSIKKIAGDIKCLITKVDIIAGAGTGTQDYEAGNYTLLCDSANPNIYYLAYFTSIDGVKENHYITLPSGVDTVGNLPATAMPCKEPKVITSCYKANGVLYTHVLCLSGTSIVSSLWINMSNNSTSTTAPAGAVSCSDPIVVCTKDLCAEIEPEVSPTQGAGLITGFINQEDFSSYANGTYTTINNTIGGTNFSIQHRDFNAANPLLGTLRSFIVESPISQNGANLPQKGIETIGGGTATFNAFVISFTTPVSAFGANILDAESNTTFGEAQVIAYDSSFNVLHSETLPSGANLVRWVKLQSTLNNISYVAIKVGDEIGGTLSDQVAVTNISFETTLAAGLTEIKEIIFYENGQLITKYYNKLTGQEILDISGLTFINCNPEPIPDFLAIRIPICVNGVNHVQQVVYLDGVLQSGATYYDMNGDPVTAPANFTLGWCEPVDYEIITSGVCIGGQNGIKKEFYEDEILIATEFSINGTIVVPSSYTDGYCNVKTVIAVEPHCATRNTGGTAYCLVYKGSYQDYLNAGGDPNGVYLGTFSEPNYDGWSYIGLCAASLPDPIDGWEWSTIKDPIYGYNGGNQYGPLTLVPSGNTFSCGITRKNIEKIKHSDNSIRWVEDSSDLQNLIDFDTTGWDVLPGICQVMQDVTYVECGAEKTTEVSSVVGAIILNKPESTESVYDVIDATITGTITPNVAGNVLTIPFAGLTVTGLSPVTGTLAVDFGSGFLNYGTTPDQDFTDQPNGEYEAKIYYIAYDESGKVVLLLIQVCEFTVTNGTPVVTSNTPIQVNRTIKVCVGVAKQLFCGNVPVNTAFDPDGNTYVFQGTKYFNCPKLVNEFVPNGNSDNIQSSLLEWPNAATYVDNYAINAPQPANATSITVTKQRGGELEVSFNAGSTWNLILFENGSRTFGQGNGDYIFATDIRFKQIQSSTKPKSDIYDVIWDFK